MFIYKMINQEGKDNGKKSTFPLNLFNNFLKRYYYESQNMLTFELIFISLLLWLISLFLYKNGII